MSAAQKVGRDVVHSLFTGNTMRKVVRPGSLSTVIRTAVLLDRVAREAQTQAGAGLSALGRGPAADEGVEDPALFRPSGIPGAAVGDGDGDAPPDGVVARVDSHPHRAAGHPGRTSPRCAGGS